MSLTCFVVHPCLLPHSSFLILTAAFLGISVGLPLLDLSLRPPVPSLDVVLPALPLREPIKPVQGPRSTSIEFICSMSRKHAIAFNFQTSNNLSFIFGLDSLLYSLVDICLENVKYIRKIRLQNSLSCTKYMIS